LIINKILQGRFDQTMLPYRWDLINECRLEGKLPLYLMIKE